MYARIFLNYGIVEHHAALKFIKVEGRFLFFGSGFVFKSSFRNGFDAFLMPAEQDFIYIREGKLCGFFYTFFVCKMYKLRRNIIYSPAFAEFLSFATRLLP